MTTIAEVPIGTMASTSMRIVSSFSTLFIFVDRSSVARENHSVPADHVARLAHRRPARAARRAVVRVIEAGDCHGVP